MLLDLVPKGKCASVRSETGPEPNGPGPAGLGPHGDRLRGPGQARELLSPAPRLAGTILHPFWKRVQTRVQSGYPNGSMHSEWFEGDRRNL